MGEEEGEEEGKKEKRNEEEKWREEWGPKRAPAFSKTAQHISPYNLVTTSKYKKGEAVQSQWARTDIFSSVSGSKNDSKMTTRLQRPLKKMTCNYVFLKKKNHNFYFMFSICV